MHVLTYNHEFAKDLSLDTMRTWRRDLRHELETRWIEPLTVPEPGIGASLSRTTPLRRDY